MQALASLLRATLMRYLGASVMALAVDFAVFLAGLRLGLPAAPASALGYGAGMAAHWWLSATVVFDGVACAGAQRRRQQAMFVASALIGLGITTGVVALGVALGMDARIAKVLAVGISFAVTYVLRARVVFAVMPDKGRA